MPNFFKRSFDGVMLSKNIQNSIFFLALALLSLALSFLVAKEGVIIGVIFIATCIGLGLVIKSLVNVQFGIYTAFVLSFFIMGAHRFYDFSDIPIALVVDAFILVVLIGIIIQSKNLKSTKFDFSVIDILYIIWVAYHILQLGNPNAVSRMAWFYAVRNVFSLAILYFILRYLIQSEKFVANMIKLWIALALLAAIYCLKQEYLGLFQFEIDWLYASPKRYSLLVTWGRIRKFSFMEGPMVLGIILAYTGVLCFTLLSGPFSKRNKIILFLAGITMIWAMMFTGTRTATVLLPVGMLFYAILTFKKKVLIGVGIFMFIGTALMVIPTGNPNLFIMKTAFRGGDDASMNARLMNQEIIQPYIRSHPIGAGVGGTGGWGAVFSPHTFIGSFPPDSEYLRVAIELGWIGLVYFLFFVFFILKTGIDNYFKTNNLRLKTFYIGILTVTFMTVIAMYPQEAIRVHPTGFLFVLCVALLNRMVTLQEQ